MTVISAHQAEAPPIDIAIELCRGMLKRQPARIAFAGRAGAGKTTISLLLAQQEWPVFNHADTMKVEVFEWLVDALLLGHDPESDASFEHFANFMGLSPSRIHDDLWELIGPVYTAFTKLYVRSLHRDYDLVQMARLTGPDLAPQIAFVDRHKDDFRETLQLYGTMSKELAADSYYWVNRTVSAALSHRICFNGDTRYREEMEALRGCGWLGIYLQIDDSTQMERRPKMTKQERMHDSEWSINPEDCDVILDATAPLPVVLVQLAEYLSQAEKECNGYQARN